MIPYTRVYAAVNLDVVEHNMKAMVANLTEGTGIMGVVKADGYGHGAVWVAGAIDPYVRGYAVATAEEAFLLRRHGISKPILILGVTHESCIRQLIEQEIRPTVFQRKQALALSRTAVDMGKIVRIHLALDTGMSRIGMRACPESADLAEEIASMPGICGGAVHPFCQSRRDGQDLCQAAAESVSGFRKAAGRAGRENPGQTYLQQRRAYGDEGG